MNNKRGKTLGNGKTTLMSFDPFLVQYILLRAMYLAKKIIWKSLEASRTFNEPIKSIEATIHPQFR